MKTKEERMEMKTKPDLRSEKPRPLWDVLALLVLLAMGLILTIGPVYAQDGAVSGTVSGTVTYYGGIRGARNIYVCLFTDDPADQLPLAVAAVPSPGGSYVIDQTLVGTDLADGTYYVYVFLDTNDSLTPDPDEPWALYDADDDGESDPVVIADGGAVTGIDIALEGPWLAVGGPTVRGGQVAPLAVHPTISGTLYAAAQPPGASGVPATIYKSTDGAANWTQISTAPYGFKDLAIADGVIYAGGINRDRSEPGPVIYRSTDGGVNWTTSVSMTFGVIQDLTVHPTDTETAVAGGGDFPNVAMLYRTDDSGATWTEVFSYTAEGAYPTVNAVLIHPTTPSTWLLSHDGEVNGEWGSYIWYSPDDGVTWTEVYSITNDYPDSLVASADPTVVYASTWNGNFHRSTDGGETWEAVITDGSAGRGLVLEPNDTLYTYIYTSSGSEVRVSTDGGDTWETAGDLNGDVGTLAIDLGPTPAALYAGLQTSGVYKSVDGGITWEERNSGIDTLVQPCDIDVDPRNLDVILVAADTGGGWLTTDRGETWQALATPHMACFAINPEDPNIVYGGGYDCGHGAVLRSEDGGLNFTPVYTAPFILPDCSGGDQGILALAIAPSKTTTVYAAGRDQPNWESARAVILRSLDDGYSWTEVFGLPAWSYVDALAISPTDDDVVYAGGNKCLDGDWDCMGFIYRTTDGGVNWSLVLTSTDTVRFIVIDYIDPDVVYASDDGFRVHKSTDGGDNWTPVRLPPWEGGDMSGNYLAMDPRIPSRLYLGTSNYVGETKDGGQTWSGGDEMLSTSLPGPDLLALVVDNGTITQTLYAGITGVWYYGRQAPQRFKVHLPLVLK
ncbi:MAG: hypothetical protein L6435_01580 [Anaerolineae bacterium]|nr:hypothetical protein [Anaerolineae bacterium]